MRTIEISEEVWAALQGMAVPFEDTPNDVLRRLLSVESSAVQMGSTPKQKQAVQVIEGCSTNPKLEGKENRERYLVMLLEQGISLDRRNGIIYTLVDGTRVVIPSATMTRPHYWFLGASSACFKAEGETILILLCVREGEILDFVLPAVETRQLLQVVGMDAAGRQIKFNVREIAKSFKLLLPGREPRDISRYLGSRDILRRPRNDGGGGGESGEQHAHNQLTGRPPEETGTDNKETKAAMATDTEPLERLHRESSFVDSAFLTYLIDRRVGETGRITPKRVHEFMHEYNLALPWPRNPWMQEVYESWDSCEKTIEHMLQTRQYACWKGRDSKIDCNDLTCPYHPRTTGHSNPCDLRKGVIWKRRSPDAPSVYGIWAMTVVEKEILGRRKVPLRSLLSVFYPGQQFGRNLVKRFQGEFGFSDSEMLLFFDSPDA